MNAESNGDPRRMSTYASQRLRFDVLERMRQRQRFEKGNC